MKSGLDADEISNVISIPELKKYFQKDTKEELLISCKINWIVEHLKEKLRINDSETKILERIIEEKFVDHITTYWKENGKVKRDFSIRNLPEWVESEFVFLAGFALWFREKKSENKTDVSELLSKATGDDVKATANIEFDQKRLKLVNEIPTQILQKMMNLSPAGKIAYKSLDMAIMKGMSDQNDKFAKKIQKKIQEKRKSWWKFW